MPPVACLAVLLICRFDVSRSDEEAFLRRARLALSLLTQARGCLDGTLGRATEQPGRWLLAVRFTSVDAYRRALSPYDVKEHVVPLLSEALTDEPATYETVAECRDGTLTEHTSVLAPGWWLGEHGDR
jgi:quinol monooxygenase YgiN